MKGNLAQFEVQVNTTIVTVFKSYKNEFKDAIGYLPSNEKNNKKRSSPYENKLISEFEQEL